MSYPGMSPHGEQPIQNFRSEDPYMSRGPMQEHSSEIPYNPQQPCADKKKGAFGWGFMGLGGKRKRTKRKRSKRRKSRRS
jgi:hypothetical protein